MKQLLAHVIAVSATIGIGAATASGQPVPRPLDTIETVVVIYAENRSFDHLYGSFPGANGLQNVDLASATQVDRDGLALTNLPPVWGGLTAKGVTPAITQAETEHLPNGPFAIDDPNGFNLPLGVTTKSPWHLFYQNQMQIDGGKNDKFVAYADTGALVMGHYDGTKLPLWNLATKYTLADNFFQAAFGGSFLNHMWIACACTPFYPDADKSPARKLIAALEPDGTSLTLASNSPVSALDGIPKFVHDGNLSPDFYAVNTMQPAYEPSSVKPAPGGDPRYADPASPSTLPPQSEVTIGDLLSLKGVTWAWYGGAWQVALDGDRSSPVPNFQFHHQPFNYFARYAPGSDARAEHLRDGGMNGAEFIKVIDAGRLPQVSFYKPQGNLNEHPGYTDVFSGDQHIADVVAHLENSPQWPHMLVVVTYDENGGLWDHVAPPKADRWGPGSRIPALIVSPFAKKGFVDHTQYDTTSILKFISERFELPLLRGIVVRDEALRRNGYPEMGDLTNSLRF